MKLPKVLGLTLIMFLPLSIVGCNNNGGDTSLSSTSQPFIPIENDSGLPTARSYFDEPSVEIHYQRNEGSYKDWGLWLWAEGKDGAEYKFNYADDYGVIAYYPLSTFGNPHSLGFIVKELFEVAGEGVWNKDCSSDRFMDIDMLQIDEHQSYHVYLRNRNSTVYTDKARTNIMNAVTTCQFENSTKILIEVNNGIDAEPVLKCNGTTLTPKKVVAGSSNTKWTFTLENPADVSDIYQAEVKFNDGISCTKSISIRNLYDDAFGLKYNYDGELGAIYSPSKTTFKVWSPVSKEIKLRIYENGTPTSVDASKGNDTFTEYEMTKGEKGVFSYELSGDLQGKYYTYFVKNSSNPNGKEVVDPYAKGCGVNGLRGMVVDFSRTNPTGWDDVNYLTYDRKELAVYETHIAELTCSDTWGGTASNAKKYRGFFESGTTYTEGGKTVSTGFDHIKELGVNAVQIIPIFDQANDEVNTSFNWGYNPLNYNCVEGSYSSNPFDGYERIKEFKELVKVYNAEGIEIIMDVVYNHVNGLTGCNFDVLMPFYYFRYTETGGASNGSGCGNETASDKYMFRKFMIDSTTFWTKEYKLGGYRFDLMGIHDVETMNLLTAANKAINPNINIWGEPWAGGTTALPAGYTAATQGNAEKYVGYGQFNDQMRDAMIKSGMNTVGNKGWVTQTAYGIKGDAGLIIDGLLGITSNATDDPDKTVNYAACHDNYTLHDRCYVAGIYDEKVIERMNVLANSLVFTSQGTSFMLAGDEMLRSKIVFDKEGNPKQAVDDNGNPKTYVDSDGNTQKVIEVTGNSYSSPYKTNELDYSLKIKHPEMFEIYKKLINLKISTSGLHLDLDHIDDAYAMYNDNFTVIYGFFPSGNKTVSYYHANGALSTTYKVDLTGAEILVDTLGKTATGNSITLEPFESLIIIK